MTREDARKAAEIMMAYANGKDLQVSEKGKVDWSLVSSPSFNWWAFEYRVAPEPRYRPFANSKECLEEMKKHEFFGWTINRHTGVSINLIKLEENRCFACDVSIYDLTYREMFSNYTFLDGSPFGIKV